MSGIEFVPVGLNLSTNLGIRGLANKKLRGKFCSFQEIIFGDSTRATLYNYPENSTYLSNKVYLEGFSIIKWKNCNGFAAYAFIRYEQMDGFSFKKLVFTCVTGKSNVKSLKIESFTEFKSVEQVFEHLSSFKGLRHAYDKVYLDKIACMQGYLFLDELRHKLPGVDVKWFIEKYMNSKIRELLDVADLSVARCDKRELLSKFVEEELGTDYKRGEIWGKDYKHTSFIGPFEHITVRNGEYLPLWCGDIYVRYQWRYNISSKELIQIIPLSEIERVYPKLRQMSPNKAVVELHKMKGGSMSHAYT